MKPLALFLSGMAMTVAGASIRSCEPDIGRQLMLSWCGPGDHDSLASFASVHCAGCVIMYAGLATMLLASAFLARRAVRHARSRS